MQTHRKNDLVDFSVLKAWAPWLLIGVAGGVVLASYMDASALIVVFAVGVLVYSIYFIFPQYFEPKKVPWSLPQGVGLAGLASALGGFSALLGIGGGTPFVVTMVICGRKVHQAVATAAGVGFIIAIPGATGFLILGLTQSAPLPWGSIGYIHVPALLAISFMTVFTSPWGAKIAQRLNELHLKRAFGIYLIAVAISMLSKLA